MIETEKNLPLEKRFFDVEIKGRRKRIAGIHEAWLELKERNFSKYISHPVAVNGRFILGEREVWLELTDYIIDDLEWLLQQKHHIFWSHMIFSKSAHQLLITFLQEAPPFYMRNEFPKDEEMERAMEKMERLVFLVFVRLSTEKESESRYVQNLGRLLYDNYIFTVPILLDICLIYGTRCRRLVAKMIDDVISAAPEYLKDFREIFPHLIHVLSIVREKFDSNEISMFNTRTITHLNGIRDLLLHLHDSTSTVQLFLDVYSNGLNLLAPESFESEIASFYSFVIPKMYKFLKSNDCNMFRNWNFREKIDSVRLDLLGIVRSRFCGIINQVLNADEQRGKHANDYLTKMMEILHEPLFLSDYNRIYPIEGDLKMLTDLCPDVDSENFVYVSNAIAPLKLSEPPKKTKQQQQQQQQEQEPKVEMRSLVTQVKDIFPGLSDGYIEACVRHFDCNAERTISAILEDNLPPDLNEIDRNFLPESSEKAKKVEEMKKKNREMFDLMNDKSDLKEMREKFSQLAIVWADDYSDEYDDTYDGQDVSIRGGDDADQERRPFVTPRVLRTRESGGEEEEEEEEEEEDEREEEEKGRRPADQFVPNPAEVRARQEQRRAERGGRGGGRDYVGRGRGRGQEKQVLANRDFKNTHKSFAGNHNRRKLASRKRNMPLIHS